MMRKKLEVRYEETKAEPVSDDEDSSIIACRNRTREAIMVDLT